MKIRNVFSLLALCIFALSIPGLLVLKRWQSGKYEQAEREITDLEHREANLIEDNKRLITEIGELTSSSRIEQIATEDAGMTEATSDEIVRVEVKSR